MKSILLPTDFSKNSVNAINFAMQLFHDEHCEFHIMNIQKASAFISDDLMTVSTSATIYQTLIDTAKRSITNLINSIEAKYKNGKHNVQSIVDYDNFIDAINQICDNKKIDLIVMGTHGASGLERIMFGSHTVRVMQRCSTPVLAIPQGCKFKKPKAIVFLSDYMGLYDKKDVKALIDMSKLFSAQIDVLHIRKEEQLSEVQQNNKAFIDECFGKLKHEFVDLKGDNIYKTVNDYIDRNHIEMLAMMNRKHSFIERLFNQHNIETFGFNIKIPFLVMDEP